MAISKKLTIAFIVLYLLTVIYLLSFLFIADFQEGVINTRNGIVLLTKGENFYWALFVAFIICFLGSASIGFPIPFPIVLYYLGNSIYLKYLKSLGNIELVLYSVGFWSEILCLTIVSGLGCALGEITGYLIGHGTKKYAESSQSELMRNINGIGKIFLKHNKKTPIFIFLFALTPLPDDILFIPLGMSRYPFWKCIIPSWIGKNFTTFFYCITPLLFTLGLLVMKFEVNEVSIVITEALLVLITLMVMFFIMSFNWNKYFEKSSKKDEKHDIEK